MQKIKPHLWFDKEAGEAARFYASIFPDSKVHDVVTLHDTPSGDTEIVTFEIAGYQFQAISAGPLFKVNPSVSFHFKCKTPEEVDAIWTKLTPGGRVRMELGEYPFSQRYGWVQDKYGVNWQLIHAENDGRQRITPVMMFVNAVCGKAEEAANFYTQVFKSDPPQIMQRYGKDAAPDKEGTVAYSHFLLAGQDFGAMDSAQKHDFNFNEAVSFMVNCRDQNEVDYYWDKLSAVPEAEQCGWLKDKYGLSWQIVPDAMGEMMGQGTSEQMERVTQAFLKMKKFDIDGLRKAYEGR